MPSDIDFAVPKRRRVVHRHKNMANNETALAQYDGAESLSLPTAPPPPPPPPAPEPAPVDPWDGDARSRGAYSSAPKTAPTRALFAYAPLKPCALLEGPTSLQDGSLRLRLLCPKDERLPRDVFRQYSQARCVPA
jgi:hypothetical protein